MAAAGAVFPLVKMGVDANKEANLKHEAKELEKNRPKLRKDVNAQNNLNLVESDLANGMSSKAETAYNDIVDREFSSSLGSILRGGGDVNSIGSLYGANEEGRQKLAIMKDNLRLNQIKTVLDQSDYVDKRNYISPFQINEYQPFQDKAAAIGTARGQAAKATNDDTNTFVSSIMRLGEDGSLNGSSKSGSSKSSFNMSGNNTAGEGSFDDPGQEYKDFNKKFPVYPTDYGTDKWET